VAVGVCSQSCADDVLFTSHRGHPCARQGRDIEATFAEFWAEEWSLRRPRRSMHLSTPENGVLGATGFVAGNLALAAGAAWAAQAQGRQKHQRIFFAMGDGRRRVHETLNLAALWRLRCVRV